MSVRTVATYAQKGHLVPAAGRGRYKTAESLHNVVNMLRDHATAKASVTGLSLQDERALSERVDREMKEIKLAELKGESMTVREISASWATFAVSVKGAVLSLPSKIRVRIPHLTNHDGGILKELCRDLLQDLSEEIEGTVVHGEPKDIMDV